MLLEKFGGEDRVQELVAAGRRGIALADIVAIVYPYRRWIVQERGPMKPPEPKVPDAVVAADKWSEVTESDVLVPQVNPEGARAGRVLPDAPLAPLGVFGEEAQAFAVGYSSLRVHIARLQRLLALDNDAAKRLDTLRHRRQAFAACAMLHAEIKGYPALEAADLFAIALGTGDDTFLDDRVDDPEEIARRVHNWDGVRRDAGRVLVPFLRRIVQNPLLDPPDSP